MDEPDRKPSAAKPDKGRRLAEALRENLRKRKAQARARRGGAGIAGVDAEGRPEIDTLTDGTSIGDTH